MATSQSQRTQNVEQVISVLCTAEAVLRGCNVCGTVTPTGLNDAALLAQLQADFPTAMWDAMMLAETLAYTRARGITIQFGSPPENFLNYDMALLGGPNICFAALCPRVRQVPQCATVQYSKHGSCYVGLRCDTVGACGVPNPADGCCPPQPAP